MREQKKIYETLTATIIEQALLKGADQVEVDGYVGKGFGVEVRQQDLDKIEHQYDREITITVYCNQAQGKTTITDTNERSVTAAIEKAISIAHFTQADECNGLADSALLQMEYPDCDLYYPWQLNPEDAIMMAVECEKYALNIDKRIKQAESIHLNTSESLSFYGNSHGFVASYPSSQHYITCSVIAEADGQMQRDMYYTAARVAEDLLSTKLVAELAVKKTVERLRARPIKTQTVPVIFIPEVACGLVKHFVNAIIGSSLYLQSSFLLNKLGDTILPAWFNLKEQPHLRKGMGSHPFDADGLITCDKNFITAGQLSSYALDVYAARKLNMHTTANAGGVFNVTVDSNIQGLENLIKQMQRGLIITDVMGQGVNITTGDYSRGASGFWVEQGEIQHAVQEITIAGNLLEMYQQVVAIADDVDYRGNIRTGSWLIEKMMVGGI